MDAIEVQQRQLDFRSTWRNAVTCFSQILSRIKTMNHDQVTHIASDGLRYISKEGGSPFQDSASGGTISCYKCGKHKPRSLGLFKYMLGQRMFKCAECLGKMSK